MTSRTPSILRNVALGLWLFAASQLALGEDSAPASWNITGECEMVTLPQKAALALLPELTDPKRFDSAYATLQGMLADGSAKLVSTLVVKTQSGEKGEASSIQEMRYPTEFDPPQVPDGKKAIASGDKDPPTIGITPTAFETRNIGASLELEASTSEGRLISVKATPSHVRFLRWARTEVGTASNGDRLFVDAPIFHTIRNTSAIFFRNGQRVLVGVGKLPDPLEGIELCFLRVSASAADEK